MFSLRKKKNNFPVQTLIWRSDFICCGVIMSGNKIIYLSGHVSCLPRISKDSSSHIEKCLFDLILYFPYNNFFQLCRDGSS